MMKNVILFTVHLKICLQNLLSSMKFFFTQNFMTFYKNQLGLKNYCHSDEVKHRLTTREVNRKYELQTVSDQFKDRTFKKRWNEVLHTDQSAYLIWQKDIFNIFTKSESHS